MASITISAADRIMSKIGYSRGMSACDPESGKVLEGWYSNSDIEAFSIMVAVRLSDAAFRFQYIPRLGSTMTKLGTDWFSPLTKKAHFMKWFNSFIEDARWFSEKYEKHEDMRVYEDCVKLINHIVEWGNEDWLSMNTEEKLSWCREIGLDHRHVISEE